MNNPFRSDAVARALSGLSPGRKLAAGTLVAVMIAGGVWLSSRQGAATAGSAMVPVLDQPFAPADLAQIRQHLEDNGTKVEVHDGKVFVRADQRLEVLSDLFYADVLNGGGTDAGFDALVKQMSAWDPPSKTDRLFNQYRVATVRNVINHFHGVRRAMVFIDPTNEHHVSGSIVPSAMVDIQTQHGPAGSGDVNPRQLANAAVNTLTGAVANLSRDQVKVTIDGASFNAGADEFAGANLLERRQQSEQAYSAKVQHVLRFIPDVMVSVSVDLNAGGEDDRRAADVEKSARADVEAEHAAGGAAADPGVPTVVVNAVPTVSNTTPPAAAVEAQKSRLAPPRETVRSASVVVPRSYFVQLFRRANRKPEAAAAADPDEAMLKPIVEAQTLKISRIVKNALGLEDESSVTVEPFDDAMPAAAPLPPQPVAQPPASASAGGPVVTLTPLASGGNLFGLGGHAREAALVAAGVVGMLLLSILFRRAQPITRRSAAAASAFDGDAHHSVLVGTLERDHDHHRDDGRDDEPEDDELQDASRMFRRVQDMVSENPDEAARVLRGWIYQGQ